MNIYDIKIDTEQITGNKEGIGLLTGIKPGFDYENGKKTDIQSYLKYISVFPDNGFEKLVVKVPGIKPILTEEQLMQQKGKVKVKFKNLSGKFYRTSTGEYALSCNADGVEVIV